MTPWKHRQSAFARVLDDISILFNRPWASMGPRRITPWKNKTPSNFQHQGNSFNGATPISRRGIVVREQSIASTSGLFYNA
jgi:hypothetical protein